MLAWVMRARCSKRSRWRECRWGVIHEKFKVRYAPGRFGTPSGRPPTAPPCHELSRTWQGSIVRSLRDSRSICYSSGRAAPSAQPRPTELQCALRPHAAHTHPCIPWCLPVSRMRPPRPLDVPPSRARQREASRAASAARRSRLTAAAGEPRALLTTVAASGQNFEPRQTTSSSSAAAALAGRAPLAGRARPCCAPPPLRRYALTAASNSPRV